MLCERCQYKQQEVCEYKQQEVCERKQQEVCEQDKNVKRCQHKHEQDIRCDTMPHDTLRRRGM